MALRLFATDLSLHPLDGNRSDDLNTGLANNDAFVVKECNTHCIQGLGKESQPAGFVDYLGALPILKTSNGTSLVGSDAANSAESVCTQLTLFYAGTVKVFENVPADKAQLIMSLAGINKSSQQDMDTIGLTASLLKSQDTAFMQPSFTHSLQVQKSLQKMQSKAQEVLAAAENSSIGERLQVPKEGHAQKLADLPFQAMVPKAMPIARKESLARFLERRKQRVRMKAPYPEKGSQGVSTSQARFQKLYNGSWAGPSMYTYGFNAEFVAGECAYTEKRHDWATKYENSKQVSEGESAT